MKLTSNLQAFPTPQSVVDPHQIGIAKTTSVQLEFGKILMA